MCFGRSFDQISLGAPATEKNEIAEHPVTLVVQTQCNPAGIIVYDASVDVPLNTREMPLNP